MTHYDYNKDSHKTYSSYFIIGNPSCYNRIIPEDNNIDIFDEENIYEFKIENITLDNNIFGYYIKKIQIITDLNEETLGFNLYSNNNKKNIKLNDILLIDDLINFKIINSSGVKLGNYSIEYIPLVSESNFEDLNLNFDLIEYYPNNTFNFSSIYHPKIFNQKKAKFIISVNKCYKTCEKCSYHGNVINHQCEICSSEYPYYIYNNNDNSAKNCYKSCPENYISNENTQYYFLCKKENLIQNSSLDYSDINTIKNSIQDLVNDSTKNIIKESTNKDLYNSEYLGQDSIQNSVKDLVHNSAKDSIADSSQDSVKDYSNKDSIVNSAQDSVQDIIKVSNVDLIKDSVQNTIQDIIPDSINDSIKYNIQEIIKIIPNESFQCHEYLPFEIIKNSTCVEECHAKDFFNKICKINYHDIKTKEHIIENIRNEISNGSMNSLLINVINENKMDFYVKEDNELYQITSSYNQNNREYSNMSTINLGICEDILKENYHIDPNDTLIIFKIEYTIEGLYIPIIKYEIYHPDTKERLNLDHCKNTKINITIPVSIDENNLFKYNSSDDYYNDNCYLYTTENGTDITLYDRKNEYNNKNLSLCEDNCEYTKYNSQNKKVICKCEIKKKFCLDININIDSDKLINKFVDFKKNSNFEVLKCYNKLFIKEGIINNAGNYILLSIIFIYMILLIIFVTKEYHSLINKINQIIIIKNGIKDIKKNKKRKKKLKNKINKVNFKVNEINKTKNNFNNIYKSFPPKKKIKMKNKKINNKISRINLNSNYNLNNNNISIYKSNIKLDLSNKIISLSNKDSNVSSKKIITETNKNKIYLKKKKIKYDYLDIELNFLSYEEALKYDKRTYCQYYCTLIKTNHILISIFENDYNSIIIKICLLLIKFAIYLAVNALFFNDSTMHKIYEDEGDYNFIYQLPQIIYSILICIIINYLLQWLALSQNSILEIKKEKSLKISTAKAQKLYNSLFKKFIWFYILSFLFLFIFWYYLSCFCAVYKNTQIFLLKDSLIGFGFSLVYPIILNLLPGLFRIPSLNSTYKDKECIYNFSKIIQLL